MTQQQGWSAPVPPPPQPKKRRKWPWVLLGVILLLTGGCVALVVGISEESGREITVRYEVTGNAKDVAITYATYSDGNMSLNQVTDIDPPWRKELKTKGFVKGGRLAVTTGAAGGTVHCRVTADGTTRTATASGVLATAVCDGF
ncbi:MmpS family transport accessory protein [Streptomyces sp. NRRL B-1347]|uniref:MmpS family transport accessory protein n=1 Tax=Streptomyces sp. NRRL B-1347 TaxID=1476877 RepID=UPI0004C9FFED|nr:MmpS family transport accessory protein [Streptomyces sp. NRRL B-1347]